MNKLSNQSTTMEKTLTKLIIVHRINKFMSDKVGRKLVCASFEIPEAGAKTLVNGVFETKDIFSILREIQNEDEDNFPAELSAMMSRSHSVIDLMTFVWREIIESSWDPCFIGDCNLFVKSPKWSPENKVEKTAFNIDNWRIYPNGNTVGSYLLDHVTSANPAYNSLIDTLMQQYGHKFTFIACLLHRIAEEGHLVKDCIGLILENVFLLEI